MSAVPVDRVADAHVARASEGRRPLTEVAVGVLMQADAQFLMTSRPPGKAYAGYWEFPGGKVEPGESTEQALARELHEELGLTAAAIGAFVARSVHAYPELTVDLWLYRVSLAVDAMPHPREHLELRWVPVAELLAQGLSDADVPLARAVAASAGAG